MPLGDFGQIFAQSLNSSMDRASRDALAREQLAQQESQFGRQQRQERFEFNQRRMLQSKGMEQEAERFKAQLDFERNKLSVEEALKERDIKLAMKNLEIQEEIRSNAAKYQYDSLIGDRAHRFATAWAPAAADNKYMADQDLVSAAELRKLYPGVEIPEGQYISAQAMREVIGQMQIDRQFDKVQNRLDKATDVRNEIRGNFYKGTTPSLVRQESTFPRPFMEYATEAGTAPMRGAYMAVKQLFGGQPTGEDIMSLHPNLEQTTARYVPNPDAIYSWLDQVAPSVATAAGRPPDEQAGYSDMYQSFVQQAKQAQGPSGVFDETKVKPETAALVQNLINQFNAQEARIALSQLDSELKNRSQGLRGEERQELYEDEFQERYESVYQNYGEQAYLGTGIGQKPSTRRP